MKKHVSLYFIPLVLCMFSSCMITECERLESLLQKWNGKEIYFPNNPSFTSYGEVQSEFNIPLKGYKIVHYVDSVGCTSCKLDLEKWKEYISFMDSVTNHAVSCLFFIHAKQKREVKIALKESNFEYPVCLDTKNEFYRLNNFPLVPMLQTFLLDEENRIVGMGDPVKNVRIRELYLHLINGRHEVQEMEKLLTSAKLSSQELDLGKFSWEMKQDTIVSLINTGTKPLVIHDIEVSCGCTVVDYDKHPAYPNERLDIMISFKAERPEFFKKNLLVHSNTGKSPLVLWIKGHAME